MEDLLNQMRRTAQEAQQLNAVTRHGIITSYDPNAHAVKVELQPDGTLTGWIPLKALWVGNGWGAVFAPAIGTAVEVQFQEADGGVGSAGLSFFNDDERPPSVPAGEAWLVHASGASIKLGNDGSLVFDSGAGATLQLKGDTITSSAAHWNHNGPIVVTSGDVTADGKSLKTHLHGGVQSGSSNTGAPV